VSNLNSNLSLDAELYLAESIPPGPKGLCKCTHELSFTNYIFHEASNQKMSVPPKAMSRKTWSQDIPSGLKEETQAIARKVYGDWVKDLEPECYRMCW
jgi:sarcosine oxidase/L-pipecolate oxidase